MLKIFFIESAIGCALFSIIILLMCLQRPENFISSWPPAVKRRIMDEHILEVKDTRMTKKEVIRKVVGCLIFVVLIGLVFKYVNKIDTFLMAVLVSYGIWFIIDWWDAFVIDMLACKRKKMRIKGTESWDKEYDNLPFHIKESFIGMILGIPFSLLVGLFVVLIS